MTQSLQQRCGFDLAAGAVIQLFWQPVIESALGESIELVGITAVRKVVVDGFFAHPQAADLLVPTQPLGELFGKKLVSWLEDQGVVVHTSRTATGIQYGESHDVTGVWCVKRLRPRKLLLLLFHGEQLQACS